MKSGSITYWLKVTVKIPVGVIYSGHKAERPTLEYEDIPEPYITVSSIYAPDANEIKNHMPTEAEIDKLIDEHADEIKDACREDSREG